MVEFLSDEWLRELDAAAAGLHDIEWPDTPLVVEQVVRRGPGDEVRYSVRFSPGGARVTAGASPAADVVLETDYATARALHTGSTRAQDALVTGRLTLRGSPTPLLRHREVLAALDTAFADVRGRTTFAATR